MNKKEKTQMEELTNKVDLLFTLLANNTLSAQALQANTALRHQIEVKKDTFKEEEIEAIKADIQKSYEAYMFHTKTVNDAIDYYSEIYGNKAQVTLNDLMEEAKEAVKALDAEAEK